MSLSSRAGTSLHRVKNLLVSCLSYDASFCPSARALSKDPYAPLTLILVDTCISRFLFPPVFCRKTLTRAAVPIEERSRAYGYEEAEVASLSSSNSSDYAARRVNISWKSSRRRTVTTQHTRLDA